jgi:ubiquinone/menaquinone biosynthesis C-methylase UbiE
MGKDITKPDWSKPLWKEMLVYQRQMLWLDDTLERLAAWMGITHGMTAVDVGCGLGYLGHAYWPYFGKGGRYIGVDSSPDLIKDATAAAKEWAGGGKTEFLTGEADDLPLPDNHADWVMCQALLAHLDNPEAALKEMIRVLKPGGLIMCKEADNTSSAMVQHFNSMRELSIEEKLLSMKVHLVSNKGRIARGEGDDSIGAKVPHMLKTLGMQDVEIRMNDKVHFLEPPYDTPLQQVAFDNVSKQVLNKERRDTWMKREREHFIAGGGSPEEYDRLKKISDELVDDFRRQMEAKTYYACGGALIYVIKGRKPAK